MRALKHRDILLGTDNGRPFVTLFIRQSKTDQEKKGTFRTLYGTQSELCPVKAVSAFISTKRGRYGDMDDLFSVDITNRVQNLLRLATKAFDLPVKRFSSHSLRSGGATSLFVSGISLEDIRRFGRWRSVVFTSTCGSMTFNIAI